LREISSQTWRPWLGHERDGPPRLPAFARYDGNPRRKKIMARRTDSRQVRRRRWVDTVAEERDLILAC